MTVKSIFWGCVLQMALSSTLFAASARPLFESKTPLQAVLSAPVSLAYKQRKQKVRLYLTGQFAYLDGERKIDNIPVKIMTRGNYRRLNCNHPPLRLNFQKKMNRSNLLAGQNKLKLVGPCKNGQRYANLVGLEYLAYQIFEQVSDYHFKTRLLSLSYIDTDKKHKPRTAMTFVIEDDADLAKRSGLKSHKAESVPSSSLDLGHAAVVEMFQFLISNYDYSLYRSLPGNDCCHNARLFKSAQGNGKLITIPYDFDMSGIVDAPYSAVPERFKIRTSRQRKFTGFCKSEQHVRNAAALFTERKNAILKVVAESSVVDQKVRQRTLNYLEKFYAIIEDPEQLKKKVLEECRGPVITG